MDHREQFLKAQRHALEGAMLGLPQYMRAPADWIGLAQAVVGGEVGLSPAARSWLVEELLKLPNPHPVAHFRETIDRLTKDEKVVAASIVPPTVSIVGNPGDVETEIFSTGEWAGREWTTEHLDEMVRNFGVLKDSIKPPLKLGHDDRQVLGQRDGQPALGWVSGLRRQGNKLLARIADMPSALRELIRLGRYKRVSSEVYPHFEGHSAEKNLKSGARGCVLAGIALLGADYPEIKNLDDLPRVLAMEGVSFVECAPPDGAVAMAALGNDAATATGHSPVISLLATLLDTELARIGASDTDPAVRRQVLDQIIAQQDPAIRAHVSLTDIDALVNGTIPLPGKGNVLPSSSTVVPNPNATVMPTPVSVNPGGYDNTTQPAAVSTSGPGTVSVPPGSAVPIGRTSLEPSRQGVGVRPNQIIPSAMPTRAFSEILSDIARANRLDVGVASERRRALSIMATEHPEVQPLRPFEEKIASLIGGRERLAQLKAIAAEHGLRLDRRYEYEEAQRLLFASLKSGVDTAQSFNEALDALARAEKVNLSERENRKRLADRVAALRPDLVGTYGSGKTAERVDASDATHVPPGRHVTTGDDAG